VGDWKDGDGGHLDEVVVTLFEGPHSYTGEDVLEISAHGSPWVLRRIVECARLSGVRLAIPGEFTLRAVGNGKMDLTQAEAVREFIEAQTEQQAKTALKQMDGSLSRPGLTSLKTTLMCLQTRRWPLRFVGPGNSSAV
jgi:tRNA modification GTPase